MRARPEPFVLLGRLAGMAGRVALLTLEPPAPGLAWRSYLGALPLASSGALVPEGGVGARAAAGAWGSVPRWVGLLPYEGTRSLERPGWTPVERREPPHHGGAIWWRYGAMLVVDHRSGEVFSVGDEPEAVRALKASAERTGAAGLGEASARALPAEPVERHRERVEAALSLIRAGDIYQVNLARRLAVALQGPGAAVFARMAAAAPSALAALIEPPDPLLTPAVYATTPELFLHAWPDGRVETLPIKGTRPRGRDAPSDAWLRADLDADPKERAELSMVVDLERNDLGKLACVGSVRVPTEPWVQTHRTLHHRVARVLARLPEATRWSELVQATLPSGSVTGAPKVRAMEVIASLESSRRGLYTGALGHVSHGGELVLAMAIRTLTVRDGLGHYHVGGGIVADSDPEREVEETRVKALQITGMLGG